MQQTTVKDPLILLKFVVWVTALPQHLSRNKTFTETHQCYSLFFLTLVQPHLQAGPQKFLFISLFAQVDTKEIENLSSP